MGDSRAQIAAIRTGERRVSQLLQRYGTQAFTESIQLIFAQSERLARAAVRTIPDGVYEAESFMEDDGVVLGKHIPGTRPRGGPWRCDHLRSQRCRCPGRRLF